ncbi:MULTISPECIES: FAD-dependent oxidoreductase [Actinomadura]|uniref:FAD-dependent oxidoreductase n=1 Tax=Actinomadura yumaensis TaxID=111807 RepID=A0ABW2CZK0_9ACTN|nr:NAD(P)/FAD-dependent oxidoreductase [Actinomadura sp. J1-007]MWK32666.1 NAD(P)-binding protein [Actinomadura sp. J1-007]
MATTGHAEIVGAGLGGLTAAVALAQRGWSVRVHERDDEIRAIGAGIWIWSNGLKVFQSLGIHDEAVEGAHIGTVTETRDARNRTVEAIPINGGDGPRLCTIVRERLIGALVGAAEKAGAEIVTGSTAVSARPDGTVTFQDGSSARGDLVVAADGVNSRLRDGLGLVKRRVRMKQGATRVLIPRQAGFVAPEDEPKYIEYFSGSRRVLYTPSSAGELYIALVCDLADDRGRAIPIDKATWRESFPHLRELIDALDGEARWDAFEFMELTSWSAGRVAVLGDAAHAQPPYLGQGGGCAMMNALGLAHAVTRRGGSPADRLRAWEAVERPVIQHTQRFSRRLGTLNALPEAPRTAVMSLMGRSRGLARSRLRAAMTSPTGYAATAASGS